MFISSSASPTYVSYTHTESYTIFLRGKTVANTIGTPLTIFRFREANSRNLNTKAYKMFVDRFMRNNLKLIR